MTWPTPQEYNEAIQMPSVCFSDVDLMSGEVELTALGIPKSITGAFASVYKIATESGDWAVRCFLTERPDQKERYEAISQYVLMDNLEYTVQFHYLDEGIKVGGKWYPILKMNWVYGQLFESYLIDNYSDAGEISKLKEDFASLVKGIDDAEMAHGDLQHGNIIISNKGLKLVDYDAIFVPSLQDKVSLELGHPNYQHPLRSEFHYDKTVDNFSSWLIYYSLSMIAIDPELFVEFSGGDECILFRRKDLLAPETSALFKRLLSHNSDEIKEHARTLIRMLWIEPHLIPELHHPEELVNLPNVEPVSRSAEKRPLLDQGQEFDSLESNRYERILELGWSTTTKPNIVKRRKNLPTLFRSGVNRVSQFITAVSKFLDLRGWINRVVDEGNGYSQDGEYDKAIELYLIAFKEAYKNQAIDFDRSQLIEIALKLAETLVLADKDSIATNYFYVAYKQASSLTLSNPYMVAHTAMLLAIHRYKKGDVDEALKLLIDEKCLLSYLNTLLKKEKFCTIEMLEMLIDFSDKRESSSEEQKQSYYQILEASIDIYQGLKAGISPDLAEKCGRVCLALADFNFQKNMPYNAMKYFELYGTINSIQEDSKDLESSHLVESPATTSSTNLSSSTAMEFSEVVWFSNLVRQFAEAQDTNELQDCMSQLEYLDTSFVLNCLEYRLLVRSDSMELFLLLYQMEGKNYPKVGEAIRSFLVKNGSNEDIALYLDSLLKSNSIGVLNSFVRMVLPSIDSKRLVQISLLVSDSCFQFSKDFFDIPILEAGTAEDILRYLTLVESDLNSESTKSYLALVIEVRSPKFVLDLFSSLLSKGYIDLVKSLYRSHSEALSFIYGSKSNIRDIITFAELLLLVDGERSSYRFIYKVVKANDESTLLSLSKLTGQRNTESAMRVLLFIYLSCPQIYQKFVFATLIENRRMEAVSMLLFQITESADRYSFNLRWLREQIDWLLTYKQDILVPYKNYSADVYLSNALEVCEELAYSKESFDYDDWNNAIRKKLKFTRLAG